MSDPAVAGLSIGQLAAATGLTTQQLRTWETRHGFPQAMRLPGGHRRYPPETVELIERVVADQGAGFRLEQAIQRATTAPGAPVRSVYAELRAAHPTLVGHSLSKRTLARLSAAIEDECRSRARQPLVLGAFQSAANFERIERRWTELAHVADHALVLADFDSGNETSTPVRVALPTDSPVLSEWLLIVESEQLAVVLAAWQSTREESRFESLWSTDPILVRQAMLLAVAAAAGTGSAAAERMRDAVLARTAATITDSAATTAVLNRVLSYLDSPGHG